MSLINDALKKAQKQRTGDTPPLASMPGIGGEPAARIAKRAKPAGFNALMLRFGLIGAGALVILVGGYFALRSGRKPAPPAPVAAPVPARSDAIPVAGAVDPGQNPASARPATATTATPVSFNLPVAPAPLPATPVVAGVGDPGSNPASARPVTTTPASPRPAAPAPVAAAPVSSAKFDGKAITYVESLRIAGIRASATDSKVLMNDRVYRTGDIVEHEMGLKLVGITSSSLTFENEAGARYTRNF